MINRKIVVLGGQVANERVTALARVYGPATDNWTFITSLPDARKGENAAYYNGKLYVTNGQRDAPTYQIMRNMWIGVVAGFW